MSRLKITVLSLIFFLFFFNKNLIWADDSCASLSGQEKVDCYTNKVAETQGQARTLSSQIDLINKQIATTEFKITQSEAKLGRLTGDIASVSGKISVIEDSLAHVSTVLINRIVKTYIAGRDDPIIYLISAENFGDFWRKLEYLRLAQKHDKNLMIQMGQTRKNYHDQKDLLEDKKNQVETLSLELKAFRTDLKRQNQEKQSFLIITQNDEARYQDLLADAQRELAALAASQFTGKKDVKKGDVIGLMGNTGFSTGAHLHFGVYNLSQDQADSFSYASGTNNPLDFLKSRSLTVDSGACYDKSGSTTVGNGSWDWPMANPRISQCFGKTPFSFVYANGRHDGLDMHDNSEKAVRAVDDGVAYFYRGNSNLGNNVRVFHQNGKMTLYLHLQ